MLAVDEENLCFAVQAIFFIIGVVNKTGFIAEARGVDGPIAVEVEEKREIFSVVDYTTALCFIGRNDLLVVSVNDS